MRFYTTIGSGVFLGNGKAAWGKITLQSFLRRIYTTPFKGDHIIYVRMMYLGADEVASCYGCLC
jgi:hypothetical protein